VRLATKLTACAIVALAGTAMASSHREAPFVTKNPKVDATDFYMFNSYETGRTGFVTLIANYLPLQDSYGGPNYFSLDPEALYEIHIDNNGDKVEDMTFQFRFQNTLNNAGTGISLNIGPADGGAKPAVAVPFANVGDPNNRGNLSVLETYNVKLVRGPRRTGTVTDVVGSDGGTTFIKPFDYNGKKSFGNDLDGGNANYTAYANGFIQTVNINGCATPAKLFVGQRAEGFAANIGPIFDLVDAPVGVITSNANRNAVPSPLQYKNVTTLALEISAACLTQGTQTTIGGWTTASVRQARVINPSATYKTPSREGGAWTQVSRLGMPLVNEVVIGIKDKDRFNSSEPKDDGQFATYVTNPTLPAVLELLFGSAGAVAPTLFPRSDLVAVFLTGVTGVNATAGVCEYQRLNTALPATPAATQSDFGAALCFVNGVPTPTNPGCDLAGYPNGRRPGDDVVDISLRVVMGYLYGNSVDAPARMIEFNDAVLQSHTQFDTTFPYFKTPNPGANGNGT
jgi:hypothetical protein